MNKKASLISIGKLFKESWGLFKKGFLKLVTIMLITWALTLIPALLIIGAAMFLLSGPYFSWSTMQSQGIEDIFSTILAVLFQSPTPWTLAIISLILLIIAAVFTFWGNLAQLIAVRDIKKGVSIRNSFKEAWRKLVSFIWISVLSTVVVLVGFLLLIVPGIIFAVWFAFVGYILICENVRGRAALSASKQLVKGDWWPIFKRILAIALIMFVLHIILNMVGIGIIGSIIAGIAAIFALIYNFTLYKDLKRAKPIATTENSSR